MVSTSIGGNPSALIENGSVDSRVTTAFSRPLFLGLIFGVLGLGQANLGLPICSLRGLIGALNPATVGRIPCQTICPFMPAVDFFGLSEVENTVGSVGVGIAIFSLQPSAKVTISNPREANLEL